MCTRGSEPTTAADRPAIRMYPTLAIRPGESMTVRVDGDINVLCGWDGYPCRRILMAASPGDSVELEIVPDDSSKPMALGLGTPESSFIVEPGVYSSSWTSGTIAAGSSQTATIRFTPLGAVSYNGTLTVSGNYTSGTNTIPISGTGQRDIPFRRSGTGNAEFSMPTDVERVRIIATYTGNSSNFMVDNGYRVLVEERLGTAWNQTGYDGTHPTPGGGYVGITNSSGVAWSFEEIR